MTKQEIEFLRAAGFTLGEIMAMQAQESPAPAEAAPTPAPAPEPKPEPSPAPAPAPAPEPKPEPSPAPAPAPDVAGSGEVQKILGQILAAIQSGNRQAASIDPPPKLTPEEIAGKLY